MRGVTVFGVLILASFCVRAAGPDPLVPAIRDAVQPEIDRHLLDADKAALAELAQADSVKARFKPPLRQRAVKEPWAALADLETRGLDLAAVAQGGLKTLPDAVNRANHFLDRPAARPAIVPKGKLETLDARRTRGHLDKHNPVVRLAPLAKAGVPIFHIHGDVDAVVPLKDNSGEVARQYDKLGGKMELKIATGQGHNLWDGFFQCQELVDFVLARSAPAR